MIDEEPMNIRHCIFCGKAVDLESESHDKPRKVRVELHYDDVYNDPEQTSKVMAHNDDSHICYDCAQSSLKHWIVSESPYSPCQEIEEEGYKEKVKLKKTIAENLSSSDIYGQLAEECCELAQAALKMQRHCIGRNEPALSPEQLEKNFEEEVSDVQLCLYGLGKSPNHSIVEHKLNRWIKRLKDDKPDGGA